MAEEQNDTGNQLGTEWHWQQWGTAWKGVGIYHVTMAVSSRQPLLGTLVIPDNDATQARVDLTGLGEKIKGCIREIPQRHPDVRILAIRMMPDHVHFVLYVTKEMQDSIKAVVRGFWQGAKKAGREHSLSISPHTMRGDEQCPIRGNEQRGKTLSIIPHTMREKEQSLPDPLFHEFPFIRPLSRKGQLDTMMRYVQMNPQRLATKRLMPGFFRVQMGIEIAGRTYSGVGNAILLQAVRYQPVHVRSVWVQDAEQHGYDLPLRNYMNGCVLAARKGTVMVSPFISPKEKQVMEVLLKEEHPFIYIADNGFREYYKPQDGLFDAVAAGRVLILSPWEYEEGKKHVTRAECVLMNQLAENICASSSFPPNAMRDIKQPTKEHKATN